MAALENKTRRILEGVVADDFLVWKYKKILDKKKSLVHCDLFPDDPCWDSGHTRDVDDYTVCNIIYEKKGTNIGCHILSYCIHNGKLVEEGNQVSHKCGNGWCCNFEHLEELTAMENNRQKHNHGTAGNKFSKEDVFYILGNPEDLSYNQLVEKFGYNRSGSMYMIMTGNNYKAWREEYVDSGGILYGYGYVAGKKKMGHKMVLSILKEFHIDGISINAIAEDMCVTRNTIKYIVKGWRHKDVYEYFMQSDQYTDYLEKRNVIVLKKRIVRLESSFRKRPVKVM